MSLAFNLSLQLEDQTLLIFFQELFRLVEKSIIQVKAYIILRMLMEYVPNQILVIDQLLLFLKVSNQLIFHNLQMKTSRIVWHK